MDLKYPYKKSRSKLSFPPLKAGDRLPLSYANFFIANGGVVSPWMGTP